MKRVMHVCLIVLIIFSNFIPLQQIGAEGNVDEATSIEEEFEDEALLQVIKDEIKSLGHSQLSFEALAEVKKLTKVRNLGIESLKGLELLTNLKELEMRSNNISGLTPLSTLTKLESIDLRENSLSSLEGIETLTNLVELDIRDNQITDLQPLAGLIQLQVLSARDNHISDLTPLAPLTNLVELNLHSNNVSDLTPLMNLMKIERLIVRGNKITDISPLQYLVVLEDLNIRDNDITDISPLRDLEKLRVRLNLDGNPINDFSPIAHYYYEIEDVDFSLPIQTDEEELDGESAEIERLFEDKALFLVINEMVKSNGHSQLTYEALTEVEKLTNVRNLGIESLKGIELLTNLKELEMRSNNISDLTPLSTLTKLESIDLRENNISKLDGIETLTNLIELDVRVNSIVSLEPVKQLVALEVLDIRDNSVIDIKPLEGLVQLKELSARNNGISDLTPLTNLTELTDLNLHSNRVSDLTPLTNLTKIERLVLRRNEISDISPLQYLVVLEDLNIRDNNITDISPLRNLEHLRVRLNLDGNSINDFSPIAHYYDDIEDVDFVIPGQTTIDLEALNPLDGLERIETIKNEINRSNQHIDDHFVKDSKLEQLAASPFAFYRGTAALFFLDVKNQVVNIPENWTVLNQANTWITGDLHIENIGFYGNRNKEAIFELNDFDEAAIAPFYFDLLNYGASLYLLNDAAPNLQVSAEEIVGIVEAYGYYYRQALANVADGSVDVQEHYFTADKLDGFIGEFAKEVSNEPLNNQLATWTTMQGENRVFDLTNNRLTEVTVDEWDELVRHWDSYVENLDEEIIENVGKDYFTIKDIARRINAGLGSLGYDRFYVLIEGETKSGVDDIILDIKAQGPSAVELSGLFDSSVYLLMLVGLLAGTCTA
ncbi:leucine-rich repeat domain-containing protein [Bacillus sp. JCM 19034]|uniref:leucine-rich repeat domain-containing protein n=1 Tax=Bacillus sp. JCM 19034 TaxID=1481928 RepID=UPI000783D277|nr:leucine-rich repeat domain-containing protein [Bacillus sp. JCM 19034]